MVGWLGLLNVDREYVSERGELRFEIRDAGVCTGNVLLQLLEAGVGVVAVQIPQLLIVAWVVFLSEQRTGTL